MKYVETMVTPALATEFVKHNVCNRKIYESRIEFFVRELRQGTFKTTHHGIALRTDGALIDGQHRCYAIIRSGIPAKIWVAFDCEAPNAMAYPVDMSLPRSAADTLGIPKEQMACVDKCLYVWYGDMRSYSTKERQFTAALVDPLFTKLIGHTPSARRYASRAVIRVAAMLRLIEHPTYALEQYHALVLQHYPDMSPATAALNMRLLEQATSREKELIVLARAWQVFDVKRRDSTRQHISDPTKQLREMRQILADFGMAELPALLAMPELSTATPGTVKTSVTKRTRK